MKGQTDVIIKNKQPMVDLTLAVSVIASNVNGLKAYYQYHGMKTGGISAGDQIFK